MSDELSGRGEVRAGRIDVSWVWTGPGERPGFRLLRRLRTHPVDPDEGYVVADSSELFGSPDEPWERMSRVRYVVGDGSTEGGLVSAALAFFHDVPGASSPVRVDLELRSPSGDHVVARRIDDVTRVERIAPPDGAVDAIEIFYAEDALLERSAGLLTGSATSVRWEPAEGVPVEVSFDRCELVQTRGEVRELSDAERLVVWLRSQRTGPCGISSALADPEEAPPTGQARHAVVILREELSPGAGEWTRSLLVSDLTVPANQTSYYTLFVEDPSSPNGWITERGWKASASGAPPIGFDDPMLGGLHSVQHYVNGPTRGDGGRRGEGSSGHRASRTRQ
jgi:hypothetical protein